MSEEELISLGFEKIEITNEISDNGYDYFYYQKELCNGIELHSTDNVDVVDDEWVLKSFDIPAIEIVLRDHYNQFLEIMGNITC
jgi:hypothetical protein